MLRGKRCRRSSSLLVSCCWCHTRRFVSSLTGFVLLVSFYFRLVSLFASHTHLLVIWAVLSAEILSLLSAEHLVSRLEGFQLSSSLASWRLECGAQKDLLFLFAFGGSWSFFTEKQANASQLESFWCNLNLFRRGRQSATLNVEMFISNPQCRNISLFSLLNCRYFRLPLDS